MLHIILLGKRLNNINVLKLDLPLKKIYPLKEIISENKYQVQFERALHLCIPRKNNELTHTLVLSTQYLKPYEILMNGTFD